MNDVQADSIQLRITEKEENIQSLELALASEKRDLVALRGAIREIDEIQTGEQL